MKKSPIIKSLFVGVFLTVLINGCSVNYENKSNNSTSKISNGESQLLFAKSSVFDWENKSVVVSYEDDFKKFSTFEKSGYKLTDNNLKQGITVKLKVIDFENKTEKTNEIMIESFELSKGVNQFTIGYNDTKPYIIY